MILRHATSITAARCWRGRVLTEQRLLLERRQAGYGGSDLHHRQWIRTSTSTSTPSDTENGKESRGSDSEDRKGTGRAAAYHDSSDNDNDSNNKPRSGGKPLTVKEQDEMMLERMKERMGLEGDELWEDGEPMQSGMRRNVKNNMFRLI